MFIYVQFHLYMCRKRQTALSYVGQSFLNDLFFSGLYSVLSKTDNFAITAVLSVSNTNRKVSIQVIPLNRLFLALLHTSIKNFLEKGILIHLCGHAHVFLLCNYQTQWNHYISACYLELCRVTIHPSDLLLISQSMEMHPQSSVKWYSCNFHQESEKKVKEQQRGERRFSDKTEIRTRLLLIKDWWRTIHCLQEKTFVKTIYIWSFC